MSPKSTAKLLGELPDPFTFSDGRSVPAATDWAARRRELAQAILPVEYGGLPPTPSSTRGELLHRHMPAQLGPNAVLYQYRVVDTDHPAMHFRLDIYLPR
jgi:hypothetical protein